MPRPRKRTEELAYPRERNGSDKSTTSDVTKGQMMPVTIPHAPKDWHPVARRLWDAFKTSGQVNYWQNTDWAFAYMVCDDISVARKGEKGMSAIMYAEILKA